MKIEALHEFHDATFSQDWADRFTPTPERVQLFETILAHIKSLEIDNVSILELGIGPGFLAKHLLERLPKMTYQGLDFSQAMIEIASKRTAKYLNRIHFTQGDLIKEPWIKKIKNIPNAIVSTWALHDLFEKNNILSVYKSAFDLLDKGGILLNGDFIKPEESTFEYEGGRIKPSEHIELLQLAGFRNVECLAEFEKSIDYPTTSNNYACFKAVK